MPHADHAIAADLSHVIEHDMVTYKGLPAPIICDFLSREASKSRYAPGTEFQIGSIEMVGNTGTYLDSPFHRFADGKDLADLPLSSLTDLRCLVVDCRHREARAIDAIPFERGEICGAAVLFHTGWDAHWRSDQYFEGHPYVSTPLATMLRDAGAALVGIDSFNIDSIDNGERPVHTILLGAEIPIVEHLRGLSQLPMRGARFFAVPPKIRSFGTFPVRAFALL
jgi:arylformamidase